MPEDKQTLLRTLQLDSLPIIRAKDVLDDEEEKEITLLASIPTSESKDVFYFDSNDNVYGPYIILMGHEEVLYKLYPNQVLENFILEYKNDLMNRFQYLKLHLAGSELLSKVKSVSAC